MAEKKSTAASRDHEARQSVVHSDPEGRERILAYARTLAPDLLAGYLEINGFTLADLGLSDAPLVEAQRLGFKERCAECLTTFSNDPLVMRFMNRGYETPDAFRGKTADQLLKIPRIGQESIAKLVRVFQENGLGYDTKTGSISDLWAKDQNAGA